MEIHPENPWPNYASCCRTCLEASDHLFDLFSMYDSDGIVTADILASCTSLKIDKEDCLPKNLCETCFNLLIGFYAYKKQAESADLKLRTCLKPKTVKLEVEFKIEEPPINNDCDYNDSFQDYDNDDDIKPLIELKKDVKPQIGKNKGKKEKKEKVESSKVKNYVCPLCLVPFHSLGDKKEHIRERHPEVAEKKTRYQCNECPKNFPKYCNLQRHIATHNADKPFGCTLCPERFKREFMLEDHLFLHENKTEDSKPVVRIKTEADIFQCEVCSIEFQSQHSLAAHMGKHKKSRTLACGECGKVFKKRSHLKRHEDVHNRIPMKCDMCEETFKNRRLLIHHINKHKGTQQYVCKICSKEFSYRSSWKAHLKIHLGVKAYLCPTCGKKFDSGNNLKHHIKRHLGDKSFVCSYCPKRFVSKGELKSHLVTHTGERPWKCDECGSRFTKSTSLTKHKLLHLSVKPYECDTCSMRFTSKYHMQRHYRIHTGERPYKCDLCERSFTQTGDLIKHKRAHLGDKLYGCTQCTQSFRLKTELSRHVTEHFVSTPDLSSEPGGNAASLLTQGSLLN